MIDEHDPPEEMLHVDAALRDRLQAAGCSGPAWDHVAIELARYGWSVMSAWLNTRMIAQKCREKGRNVELPGDWTIDDREDLVATAVAYGLELFRQAILDDRWKPERGASLRTYFLGSCVLVFPNALRAWDTERQRYRRAVVTSAREAVVQPPSIDPVDVIDAVDALRSLTSDEGRRSQAIRYLCFNNYTPAEIAEVLGMTPGAVNAALSRMRRRHPEDGGGSRR